MVKQERRVALNLIESYHNTVNLQEIIYLLFLIFHKFSNQNTVVNFSDIIYFSVFSKKSNSDQFLVGQIKPPVVGGVLYKTNKGKTFK